MVDTLGACSRLPKVLTWAGWGRKKSFKVDLNFFEIDQNSRNLGFQHSVRPNTCRAARGVGILLFFGGGFQKSQHHAHAGMNRYE